MCSTCFGHEYIHHQELATILLNYHIGRIVLGSIVLEFRCGWDGVVSVLQAEAGLDILEEKEMSCPWREPNRYFPAVKPVPHSLY